MNKRMRKKKRFAIKDTRYKKKQNRTEMERTPGHGMPLQAASLSRRASRKGQGTSGGGSDQGTVVAELRIEDREL
jgi:hypothetical protein